MYSMRRSFFGMRTIGLLEIVCGQMGVRTRALSSGARMGPPAAKEYAVEPLGVAMIMPSAEKVLRYFPST